MIYAHLNPISLTITPVITERFALVLMRSLIYLASMFLLLFVTVSLVSAQNIQHPDNKPDMTLRSTIRVDPTTLGMSMQIPIRDYPGRAGTSAPVILYYSSKVWNIKYSEYLDGCVGWGEPTTSYTVTIPQYAEKSASGWTTSLALPVIEGDDQTFYNNGQPCGTCIGSGFHVRRLFARMPDGSSHELRMDDGLHLGNEAFATGDYYAVDGSGMRYNAISSTAGTLYLQDGSRYLLGAPDASGQPFYGYIDRNGNVMDSLGRGITAPVLDNSVAGSYTYTAHGVTTPYTLEWDDLGDVLTDPSQALQNMGDRNRCGNDIYSPSLFVSTDPDRVTMPGIFNPVVLHKITFPNGTFYKFTYNIYGEIDKVIYPTGAFEKYTYSPVGSLGTMTGPYSQANRGVVERHVSANGTGSDDAVWLYAGGGASVTTTMPDGTRTVRLQHQGRLPGQIQYAFDDVLVGMTKEEQYFSAPNSPGGQEMLRRKLIQWTLTAGVNTATRNPRVTKEVEILMDPGCDALLSTTTYEYDADFNVIKTNKFDYTTLAPSIAKTIAVANVSPGTLLRTEEVTFLVNDPAKDTGTRAAYRSRNLLSLPTSTRIKDTQGTIVAQARMDYDETGTESLTPYGAVTGWKDPQTNIRGNTTTSGQWLNTTNTYIETRVQYDECGSVRYTWDANGNKSQIEYSSAYKYAYPTRAKTPAIGSIGPLETTATYDLATGQVTSVTDPNGQTTSYSYTDPVKRLKSITRPNGGGMTQYDYGDTVGSLYVRVQVSLDTSRTMEASQYFDGMGRATRSSQAEGGTSVLSDTEYDSMGRASRVSNPYRAGDTIQWTTTVYDSLGRAIAVTTPDNAVVTTNYLGAQVLVTDQAQKRRLSWTNALGKMTDVWEITTADGATESVTLPGYSGLNGYRTSYKYDLVGNLRTVTQGSQKRYFLYDSLSRLIRARNPELDINTNLSLTSDALTEYNSQWSLAFSYEDTGNLLTKTDTRGTTSTYAYDAMNRIIAKSYSGGTAISTPTVTYAYDISGVTNSKGRLTSVSSSVSTYNYTGYDALGRVTASQQVTDGQTYSMSYAYDLAGNMTNQTYPTGRVVSQKFDGAGRLVNISGQATGGTPKTYVNSFGYTPHSAVERMRLGNGRWEHTNFNNRLQLKEIGLGASATDNCLLKLIYEYGASNNGNVVKQVITVPTIGTATGFTATQHYQYDSLNRLMGAQEVSGTSSGWQSSGALWQQMLAYDRFGNRNFVAGSTIPDLTNPSTWPPNIYNPQLDQNTNRIASGQSYTFDLAGDVTQDASGKRYGYDAESKQAKFFAAGNSTTNPDAVYSYDGHGKRVKKAGPSELTIFVYNINGQLVAEYTTSATWNNGTSYLTCDTLGTPRTITNADGVIRARHDYLPFGEEIYAQTSGRTTAQGYAASLSQADNLRQKFTSKERDIETGLDWLGPGRYYSAVQGRFTTVDPGGAGASSVNPQSLNRYSYTMNRPTVAIDPDGLSTIVVTVTAPAGGGNPTASILYTGRIELNNMGASVRYDGLAAGLGRDRMTVNNDTPYGVYTFDGTQGGNADSRLGVGFGTGKILITGQSGEIIASGRTLFRFHGGGTPLGDHAYDLDQNLLVTLGCVRMHNRDVNALIGSIGIAQANQDPLDRIFIGSQAALTAASNQTDGNGNYVNPDLRLAMGLFSTEQERQALEIADTNRRIEVQRQREEQIRRREDQMRRHLRRRAD